MEEADARDSEVRVRLRVVAEESEALHAQALSSLPTISKDQLITLRYN